MKKSEKKLKKFLSPVSSNLSKTKEGVIEKLNFNKNNFITLREIIISISFIFIFILIIGGVYLFCEIRNNSEKIFVCGDGTFYDTCSLTKPYFCSYGKLVKKASVCGCSELSRREGDNCISEYQVNPKHITLKYTLGGQEDKINYIIYDGFYDYISKLSRFINYREVEKPSRKDFKLKVINNEDQREMLMPLVIEIQNRAENKKDQAKIAKSIVQNIPYKPSFDNVSFWKQAISSRYPYEVLYDGAGICGEKSELLAFLLKELDYGVAIFYFSEENHEAVGIKCPFFKDFRNTGYCFIETTEDYKIGNSKVLKTFDVTSTPEIILISDGESF